MQVLMHSLWKPSQTNSHKQITEAASESVKLEKSWIDTKDVCIGLVTKKQNKKKIHKEDKEATSKFY